VEREWPGWGRLVTDWIGLDWIGLDWIGVVWRCSFEHSWPDFHIVADSDETIGHAIVTNGAAGWRAQPITNDEPDY
jgi:hypothetical protein